VWQTLAELGHNDKALRGDLSATAVLHTHSRALDYHPHVHVVIPAGAVDPIQREWRTKPGRFLFSHQALAKVFRAKWFAAMAERGWRVSARLPEEWVVDCKHVGNGDKALIYLGRYLYRGVLPEKNILRCEAGQVTFRYTDNQRRTRTRTLAGADFLWLLLRHVLPKGFRRSRDYGLLHPNRKRLIQLLHPVKVVAPLPKPKVPRHCRECGGAVTLSIIPFLVRLVAPSPPRDAPARAAM
jgi:Putative transposase/TrwC relaxase